ncbi:MAG: trans-acting enoyl reductase family protein, partial [Haloarculaceae archaeon]
GFDVVPTDCLAAHVVDRLPDASTLELAFEAEIGVSPGTAKTVVKGLDLGGSVRRDGVIERVPPAHETRTVDFDWDVGERTVAAIPWGDVATAHYTTGVPNVTTYMSMPPSAVRWQRIAGHLSPLLGLGPVKSVLTWLVDRTVEGPDAEDRAEGDSYVWAEATTPDGERAVSRLRCPHTYTTTVLTALAVTERVLDGDAPAGYQTPAGVYGPDLILDIEGTEREDVI